jgi:hypothetical protein
MEQNYLAESQWRNITMVYMDEHRHSMRSSFRSVGIPIRAWMCMSRTNEYSRGWEEAFMQFAEERRHDIGAMIERQGNTLAAAPEIRLAARPARVRPAEVRP